jgi:hypothetical protein
LCDSPSFIYPKNQPSCPSSKFFLTWHWRTALYSSLLHSRGTIRRPTIKYKTRLIHPRKASSSYLSAHFPHRPHHQKARPPGTINTRDIEQYVQPLYARGWGHSLSGILPHWNGIAVLRKWFEFANSKALERLLTDLSEYEEKKQVRFSFRFSFSPVLSPSGRECSFADCHALCLKPFSTSCKDECVSGSYVSTAWTDVARRRSGTDAKVEDKDQKKIERVTARDIWLGL